MGDPDNRSGRDTRLLALVIVISLAVLLVLARFRFPAADLTAAPTAPGPLERLVARATYEELAANVSAVLQRATPAVVVFQLDPVPPPETASRPAAGRGLVVPAPPPAPPSRLMAGVRITAELAVGHILPGFTVGSAVGSAGIELMGIDADRGIALVRMPASADAGAPPSPSVGFSGFSYVMVIEAAAAGPTARPEFLGRVDATADSRWSADLLIIAGTSEVPDGGLVFSLDGRFVGLAVPVSDGGRGLAPLSLLEAAASALSGPGKGLGP